MVTLRAPYSEKGILFKCNEWKRISTYVCVRRYIIVDMIFRECIKYVQRNCVKTIYLLGDVVKYEM